jgi:beta-galactosidase
MKPYQSILGLTVFFCALNCFAAPGGPQSVREKLLLDSGWRFHLGDASGPEGDFQFGTGTVFAKAGEAVGAIHPNFNDSSWRAVDLPHDWAVEQDFVNLPDDDLKDHGFKPTGRKFPKTTIGWYRRAFLVPTGDQGRRLAVKFDGVFRDCIVWINGHYLGNNLSGYSEFSYDITDYVKYGQRNVLVVRADASQYEGWFYEGAGIYRHAWLLTYGPVHVPEYGVCVRSAVGPKSSRVDVQTEMYNQNMKAVTCDVYSVIQDENGKTVARAVTRAIRLKEDERMTVPQQFTVRDPLLWSIESPHLYRVVSLVRAEKEVLDSVATTFGIRTVLFDKDKGFFLNGRSIKIKGVCCHQDHAGVGSALPDRLQYYRIQKLKEMGCNAYRTSHNPPTSELLEACDRLGMLVMDENRLMGSTPEMMGQFERLILRDRNHPSVIIWSLGNEEFLIQSTDVGRRVAESLLRRQRELDPTRLSTYAANNGNQFEGINSVVPVRGINYMALSDIDRYRKDHPGQILWGSEEASTLCTRGIYANDTVRGYLCDYDRNKPDWGSTAEAWWKFYAQREWLAGAFVWTGFDYRGEPTPYSWPCISSHFGIMDVCGYPKNNYYYYQAWWSDRDVLHLCPHWNWRGKEGQPIEVWCQSNCEDIELFLNGRSLGKKTMEKNSHLEWMVPYEPGVLEARGTRNGKVLNARVETTDSAASIRLIPDRSSILADGEDVAVVSVEALDARGREIPTADNLIRFDVAAGGRIIGVGNGDPSSHEPDKVLSGGYQRRLFNGKAQVIIQASRTPGEIRLTASSDGMKTEILTVVAESCAIRPWAGLFAPVTVSSKAKGATVTYTTPYHARYPGGGPGGLVDGITGSADYQDMLWQGFEKNDLEAVIDLGKNVQISRIYSNYLQDIDSWIFLPTQVEYALSEDGKTFTTVAVLPDDVPAEKPGAFVKSFSARIDPTSTRYVRVHAKNIGLCPPWHRSAGGKAWLFVDEVVAD